MARWTLCLLMVCLCVGTAPIEVATALTIVMAVWVGARNAEPMWGPVAAVAFCCQGPVIASIGTGTEGAAFVAAVGQVWPLALLLSLPPLVARIEDREKVIGVGLWACAALGLAATLQGLAMGQPPWSGSVSGPFSHHLTLGYTLVIPLSFALSRRRWGLSVCMATGVCMSGASGPLLSMAVVVVGLMRPRWALAGGIAIAMAVVLVGHPDLGERAVLWLSGAQMATTPGLGTGPVGYREAAALAQDATQSGFHFPLHAHDTALQIGALVGTGGWIAWSWLGVVLWKRCSKPGQAAIAAIVVGGLTQDTLGDLEVIRMLCAWCLLEPMVTKGVAKTAHKENG